MCTVLPGANRADLAGAEQIAPLDHDLVSGSTALWWCSPWTTERTVMRMSGDRGNLFLWERFLVEMNPKLNGSKLKPER